MVVGCSANGTDFTCRNTPPRQTFQHDFRKYYCKSFSDESIDALRASAYPERERVNTFFWGGSYVWFFLALSDRGIGPHERLTDDYVLLHDERKRQHAIFLSINTFLRIHFFILVKTEMYAFKNQEYSKVLPNMQYPSDGAFTISYDF